jgi:tetratricopeptide (TPR) repeat protein
MPELNKTNVRSRLKSLFSYSLATINGYLGSSVFESSGYASIIKTGYFDIFSDVGLNLLNSGLDDIYSRDVFKHTIISLDKNDILQNPDLNKISIKTISTIILEEANRDEYGFEKRILKKVGNFPDKEWERFFRFFAVAGKDGFTITEQEIDELVPVNLLNYFNVRSREVEELTFLSTEAWKNILDSIFEFFEYYLSKDATELLARRFYEDYTKVLKKNLINDLSLNGKAYASMQFRILGELLQFTKKNYELSDNIYDVIDNLNKKIDEIIEKSPNYYSLENANRWDDIFDDFNSFKERQNITHKNTEIVKKDAEIIEESLRNQANLRFARPQGLINIPHKQNPYFIEQENIFEKIEEQLKTKKIASLHGIHGLGKTTIVVEYAYRVKDRYDFIVFILATEEKLEQEMAYLAERFIEGAKDVPDQKAKAEIFKEFLETQENYLVIFDNLESNDQIRNYFPHTYKGDILYTCNKDLYIGESCEVKLDAFSQTEAELFLYRKANADSNAENEDIHAEELSKIQKVISELGKLPIALNIAGAYINKKLLGKVGKANHYDIYVDLLEKNLPRTLQIADINDLILPEPLIAAFTISLEKIKTPNDESENEKIIALLAEAFLNICAFCVPEEIPEDIIYNSLFEYIETKSLPVSQRILWKETVALLNDFNLIEKQEIIYKDKDRYEAFEIHRSLQKISFVRLNDDEKLNIAGILIEVFLSSFPEESYRIYEGYGKYVPHAQKFLTIAEKLNIKNHRIAVLYNQIGFYLKEIGQYAETEPLYIKAKDIRETIFGENHPDTAASYNNLAGLYDLQGRYAEAEPLYIKAKDIREKMFGETHPYTATIYNNLAGLYDAQNRFEEAEPLYIKAINIFEKVFGKTHPDTATSYNNLAGIYRMQGRFNEAESLYKKSLAISEEVLGKTHPFTATSYNNLALFYNSQDKYNEAESLFIKSKDIQEKVLGENHPNTATSYMNLGAFYYKQGKYVEALELCEKALKILSNYLPENHPNIKICESWIEYIKKALGE